MVYKGSLDVLSVCGDLTLTISESCGSWLSTSWLW